MKDIINRTRMKKYITYYRVSTKKQGKSGLGLNAQMATVQSFLKGKDAEQIEIFTEIESGKNGDRPVLKSAITMCKETGAILLIAKLDRLSRNVAFLFNLKEELESAGVSFVACDIPEANNTMVLGVMATMAQHEAEIISQRTKEGIRQSETYKSGEWGNPQNFTDESRAKAHQTISRKARTDKETRKAFEFIRYRRDQKEMTYQAIADELNKEGYQTRRGKKFHPAQVRKIYLRFTESIESI